MIILFSFNDTNSPTLLQKWKLGAWQQCHRSCGQSPPPWKYLQCFPAISNHLWCLSWRNHCLPDSLPMFFRGLASLNWFPIDVIEVCVQHTNSPIFLLGLSVRVIFCNKFNKNVNDMSLNLRKGRTLPWSKSSFIMSLRVHWPALTTPDPWISTWKKTFQNQRTFTLFFQPPAAFPSPESQAMRTQRTEVRFCCQLQKQPLFSPILPLSPEYCTPHQW